MIKSIVLFAVLGLHLFAQDTIYFLPKEADEVKNKIITLIKNAKESIDVAMYNIDDKKFAKALKTASKNGVDVSIIYEKSKLKFYKNIKLISTQRKQHIKLAIIDDKFAVYGSANWKKESFGENYEIINITDDPKKIKRFQQIIKQIKKEN